MIEKTCPLGHTCERCLWYGRMRGIDPQTGQEIDREDCAVNWLVVLGALGAQKTDQVAATVESFRNHAVAGLHEIAEAAALPRPEPLDLKLIGGNADAPN